MSRILFTSDTHFGQERTLQLSKRPFRSVTEMDRELIENWNIFVSGDDVVYHLGDFGNPEVVHRLRFHRLHLIPGNYDTPEVISELCKEPRVDVLDDQPVPLLPPDDTGLPSIIHLIHEPEKADDPEAFYLFGHIHQLQVVKRNGLNVGTDCHRFHPIGYQTVKFYYDAITLHYDGNVFVPHLGYEFEV
jgi:calcineurin-like phosphoesterase family protein